MPFDKFQYVTCVVNSIISGIWNRYDCLTFREENCVAVMFVHQTGELGLKVDINDERNGHEH